MCDTDKYLKNNKPLNKCVISITLYSICLIAFINTYMLSNYYIRLDLLISVLCRNYCSKTQSLSLPGTLLISHVTAHRLEQWRWQFEEFWATHRLVGRSDRSCAESLVSLWIEDWLESQAGNTIQEKEFSKKVIKEKSPCCLSNDHSRAFTSVLS